MKQFIKNRLGLFIVLIFMLGMLSGCNQASTGREASVAPRDDQNPHVVYQTHVQNEGWQDYVENGLMSGTEGMGYRLEGIKIKIDAPKLNINYQTHIQNIGWEADTDQGWKKDNEMSGTEGLSYRLEAIQIKLTGSDADQYDLYYQVHAENFGWLGWAKNGESSGTAGYGYRLEGIHIKIQPVGLKTPSLVTEKPFYDKDIEEPIEPTTPIPTGELKVSYLDVEQAESIFIQQGEQSMLIDAGNKENGTSIKNYIQDEGVSVLDYVIATHPHADHIGAMDYIINSFKIGKVYMPEVTANTKTFENFVQAMFDNGLKASKPVVGETFMLGDAECEIMGPMGSVSGNLNSYSIVLKITYGENSFLFTGDAEDINERAMVQKGLNISSDVLSLGHHGSSTSSIDSFLAAVDPRYGVASCGVDNQYGHPSPEVLDRINARNIELFRTDFNGTVVAISNGVDIVFNTDPVISPPIEEAVVVAPPPEAVAPPVEDPVEPEDYLVYKTNSGKKYHQDGCQHLSKSKIALMKSEAIGQGLEPCKVCRP